MILSMTGQSSMHRVLPIFLALLVIGLYPAPADGQLPGLRPPGQRPAETQRFHDSRDRVTVEVTPSRTRIAPGEELVIAVTFRMDEKWKIWAADQPLPEMYFKTRIIPEVDEASGLVPLPGAIQWPPHKMGEFFGDELPLYDGQVTAYLPILIGDDAQLGPATITLRPIYQACDDRQCLAPTPLPPSGDREPDKDWLEHGEKVQVSIVAANELTADDRLLTSETVFAEFDWSIFDRVLSDPEALELAQRDPAEVADDDAAIAATEQGEGIAGLDRPIEVSAPSFFGIKLPRASGAFGLLLLAIFSAIGGFVLNLTPCVLPVIPIKVMTILQHANKPGKNLVLGLWMALGVVAFWVGIGLPVAFLTGVTDPSQLFGIWWVTFGIGAIIALMGLGIMGLFSIQLPQSVYAVNPKADSAWGSFMFGVMTAILGLPCFGFVAGALLAGAATLPPSTIMVIFTSLGVGMAAPYVVLSLKPGWLEKIPRTGPASELVKQVMGLLLIAAAAYFIGAGLIALVAEHPYLARQLHWWAVAIFVTLAAIWLVVRTVQISPKASIRASFLVIGVVLSSIALVFAVASTGNARHNWEVQQEALAKAGSSGYVVGHWNQWSQESFEQARDDGNIVLLDFTAEWCINCKFLKATILDRDPVRAELANADVVKFTVDLTSRKAPGWQFLRDLGQTGIPLLAIYAPGRDEPWQSNAYTPQQVLSALAEARAIEVARKD
jgi:thiol:disulfide interchange protein